MTGKSCCVLDCDLICWILLWFNVTDMISVRLMINELRFNMRLMNNELWFNMILCLNVTDMKTFRLMINELRFNMILIFNGLMFNTRLRDCGLILLIWKMLACELMCCVLIWDWYFMSYGLTWKVWLYCLIYIISS